MLPILVPALAAAALVPALRQAEPPAPLPPLPSERQLAWHARPHYAFVHFNMNTFTGSEWGTGAEDPDLFQPSALDCRQWVQVFRDAGMSGVILTAKHHDGFCLWPSRWSEHTVARSSWRGGKGDVVRELADACREAGLGFGVYLSPWDRNHPRYGDSPAYDEVFRGQLEELATGYGELFEIWFDGACGEGPNGKRQVHDWPSYVDVVRRLQPRAVVFSDAGPDVRWVGNEAGFAGETCWSLVRRDELFPGTPRYAELTSGHPDGTHWVPAECDVSLRPGWYWRESEDGAQKSVAELLAIWDASVGRNAALLLNVPPDRRGLVHERDAERLLEFRRAREAIYGEDRAQGGRVSASNVRGGDPRYAPEHVLDADASTCWSTDDGERTAWLTIELARERLVDRVQLEEGIAWGQRIESFSVHAREGEAWRPLARGTTIGARRILAFPPVRTDAIRVSIDAARGPVVLARAALHCAPARPSETELRPGVHTFAPPKPGLWWRYREGVVTRLDEAAELDVAAEGTIDAVELSPRRRDEHFALELTGFLDIPRDGVWSFHLASDDGSRLLLHGEVVVENDGAHGLRTRSGAMGLRQGLHPLRIEHFQATGELGLELEIEGPGQERATVPAGWLVH